ncbi:MAG: 2,5 ligase [Candidatus Angelobacter sp.]|jgi:2'-5' RNA ligase|nr:2,5 ligase [Candidatus Angelobacter sp.]
MRLFVGIDITDDIRERISSYVAGLQREFPAIGAKWVKPESLHLTLKFIGESKEPEKIKSVLSSIQAPSFEISFRSVGFFTPRSPRIFWAGVQASEDLPLLANTIDSALGAIAVARETQDYSPHLTLARVGSGKPYGDPRDRNKPTFITLRARVESLPQPDFGTMIAKEFFLFQSETLPSGPRYTKLARFELK